MLRRPEEYESPSCATIGGDFWFPDNEIPNASTNDAAFAKSALSGVFKKKLTVFGAV
jgi:hypothetical protein